MTRLQGRVGEIQGILLGKVSVNEKDDLENEMKAVQGNYTKQPVPRGGHDLLVGDFAERLRVCVQWTLRRRQRSWQRRG